MNVNRDGEASTFSAHLIGAVAVAGPSNTSFEDDPSSTRQQLPAASRRATKRQPASARQVTPSRPRRKPKSARRVETLLAAVQVWTGRGVRQLTPIDLSAAKRDLLCRRPHGAPRSARPLRYKLRPQAGSGEGSPAGDPSSYRLAICSDTAPIRL